MAQRFVACDREQSFLMPPDVREWLPENHLAWFVISAVEEMNLDAFYAAHRVDRALFGAPSGRARGLVRGGAHAVRAQRAGEGRGDRGRRDQGAGQRVAQ